MKTILVLDDDAAYRRVCSTALQHGGYAVQEAADGAEALRLLQQHPVALVLTDILMPEMDGMEMIMAVRRHHPAIRVIAMSGGGTVGAESCLQMAHRLGACATLQKPFTVQALLALVESSLAQAAG